MAIYYTFKELAELIRSQDFWFHFGVLRTGIIKHVQGGYAAVMKNVLHTFISDDESFCHVGIAMDVGSGPGLFYAKVWRLLADGAALAATFDWTSASGTKSCFCCVNGLKPGTFDDESEDFVPITCVDPKKFVLHTNESVWKSVDDQKAMAATFNKTTMKRIQQCYGFKLNPHGWLMDATLREFAKPVDLYRQDWPHIFLQHGVGNIQMYHLFESTGIDINELQLDAGKTHDAQSKMGRAQRKLSL